MNGYNEPGWEEIPVTSVRDTGQADTAHAREEQELKPERKARR